MFRPSREPRGDDPRLPAKIGLFAAGAVCGLGGMATGHGWLVWTGVALLAVGLLLRFLPDRHRDAPR